MKIEQYNEKKDEFVKLLKDQIDLLKRVKGWDCNELENKLKKLQSETEFNVLVVGRFSSGKSTFLNAILGEDILPHFQWETTAIITEISYSKEEKIILYPKDGEPFNIKKEELEKYICIDEKNDNKEYNKLVIKFPFDKKWKGCMFVDSPGCDGVSGSEQVTKDYLTQADLIIYCMPATQAYDIHDKERIKDLKKCKKDVIPVITKFGIVQKEDAERGRHDAEKLKEKLSKELKEVSDFGVFFVDSFDALSAKEKNNDNALKKSGFVEMEDKVSKVLFLYKHKFPSMLSDLIERNKKIQERLESDIKNAPKKRGDRKKKLEKAYESLREKTAKKDEIITHIEDDLTDYRFQLECRSKTRDFIDGMRRGIPRWVEEGGSMRKEEFGLSEDKYKKYANGIMTYVRDKVSAELVQWIREELLIKNVNKKIIETLNQYKNDFEGFFEEMKEVNKNITYSGINISDQFDKGFLNELNITSLVLGNIAINSGLLGIAVAFDLIFSLGIISFIITTIMGVLGSWWFTEGYIEKKRIKFNREIEEEIQKNIAKSEEKIQESVWKIVGESINKVLEQIEEKMGKPLKELKQFINNEEFALHSSEKEFKNRIKLYCEMMKKNDEINKGLNSIEIWVQNENESIKRGSLINQVLQLIGLR